MRRSWRVIVLCLMLCSTATLASDVNEIFIGQSTGMTAEYDHLTGTGRLTWSSGVAGYVYTMGGEYAGFDSIDGVFGLDLISTTGTSAKFDLDGLWSMDFYDSAYGASPVLELSGTLNGGRFDGQYWENVTDGGGGVDGKAWVNVGIDAVNSTWVGDNFSTGISAGDSIFGLQANAILDVLSADFDDYASESYDSTEGLTLTFWGNQDVVVPEPMTIALLGLGGLLIRRKK
jgi:hypothetical protein